MTQLLTKDDTKLPAPPDLRSQPDAALVPSCLLKELGSNVGALGRVIESLAGGSVDIGSRLGGRLKSSPSSKIGDLKPRALEVLTLMAQGCSNYVIADRLSLQLKTVENHINCIYQVLNLSHGNQVHARVQAVLHYITYTSLPRISRLEPVSG